MRLLRLLLVTLRAAAGLVVFAQVPAVACSCAAGTVEQYVERSDAVFSGVLADIEQTEPGGDRMQSSLDPVFYAFDIEQSFKGDPEDDVISSARFGASCGLEGMKVDQTYVVFANVGKEGALEASLCGGTSRATPRLIAQVEAALPPATEPSTPTLTQVPTPLQPVPTQVPSGLEQASSGDSAPAWAWFGGGVLLALLGSGAVRRRTTR